MATKSYDPAVSNPAARAEYLDGAPLTYLRRRYRMSRSELEDVTPEESRDAAHKPEGSIGGY